MSITRKRYSIGIFNNYFFNTSRSGKNYKQQRLSTRRKHLTQLVMSYGASSQHNLQCGDNT